MNKKELWLKLNRYQFDHVVPPNLADLLVSAFGGEDASSRAFAAKIARKLEWDDAFSLRALKEYKKFLYLGVIAGFVVTPPRVIDQVWHEHLLFTRAYREFCEQILGRPFDHNPELIPTTTQTRAYQAQYEATLALYATEFGYEPPSAYWGTPKFEAKGQISSNRNEEQVVSFPPNPASGSVGYSNDPPLVLWVDSSLSSTFAPDDRWNASDSGGWFGDLGGSDSGSTDTGSGDSGGSDGGGCSSGCGGGGD